MEQLNDQTKTQQIDNSVQTLSNMEQLNDQTKTQQIDNSIQTLSNMEQLNNWNNKNTTNSQFYIDTK